MCVCYYVDYDYTGYLIHFFTQLLPYTIIIITPNQYITYAPLL